MSRTRTVILNAKINIIFYTVNLLLAFYSRKIFINLLGASLLGLTSTISNILSFLSLAEFGVGTAISYLLFKPLYDKNKEEINNIVNSLNYYYKRIGGLILLAGLILSVFLPYIFKSAFIPSATILAVFFTYLIISSFEYFFNYKQILLFADQKKYLATGYLGFINLIKVVIQIVVVHYSNGNIYLYLLVELILSLAKILCLKLIINKEYPWLKVQSFNSKEVKNYHPKILEKTKQIFSHQVAGFILAQTDQLLIFSFTTLKTVTYYNNYLLIVQNIISLLNQPFLSIGSSIGNLVASGDKENIKKIFTELLVLKYWLAGLIVFTLYKLVSPFIQLWLGQEFILNNGILILILINAYITITRQPLDAFLQGYGIFNDTWAPWTEAILNITISITLGYYYDVIGVLWGTFISTLLIISIWKPYLLYSNGFKESVKNYWKTTTTFNVVFLFCVFVINLILSKNSYNFGNKYISFGIQAIMVLFTFGALYSFVLWVVSKDMRNLMRRFYAQLSN